MDYQRPERIGYAAVPVLEFLNQEPWGDRILDFAHSLRPSEIRIVPHGQLQTDTFKMWRVTVKLTKDNLVQSIKQEVEVGLRTADHGHGLLHKIPRGTQRGDGGMAVVNMRAIKVLERSQKDD